MELVPKGEIPWRGRKPEREMGTKLAFPQLSRENTFTLSPSLISPESDASGGLTTFEFAPLLQFLSLSHQSVGDQAARTLRPDLDQGT